jgi:hypothetical protein
MVLSFLNSGFSEAFIGHKIDRFWARFLSNFALGWNSPPSGGIPIFFLTQNLIFLWLKTPEKISES